MFIRNDMERRSLTRLAEKLAFYYQVKRCRIGRLDSQLFVRLANLYLLRKVKLKDEKNIPGGSNHSLNCYCLYNPNDAAWRDYPGYGRTG
jgi:hypothetical protein